MRRKKIHLPQRRQGRNGPVKRIFGDTPTRTFEDVYFEQLQRDADEAQREAERDVQPNKRQTPI